MTPVVSLAELLGRRGSKIGTPQLQLPTSVVTHDSIDAMEFGNFADDSPRFRRIAIEDAPVVEPNVPDPPEIDFTAATPQEIREWQAKAREAKAARDAAPPYRQWDKLTRDVFYSYHTHDQPDIVEPVDPGVELHKRILPKLMTTDDHAQSRNVTRDDPTLAAIATMAAVNALRDALGDELKTQAQEAQEFEDRVQDIRDQIANLEELRQQARDYHDAGQPVPADLRQDIQQAVKDKRSAQAQAAEQAAAGGSPMNGQALAAIEAAAAAGSQAAEQAKGIPSFGQGFGQGEPVYESPEQALSIAQMWAENPDLRAMAELFGRLDKDIRFQRAKRVVGGADEIVDIEFGDNLSRVLPAELALFADPDFEDDFLMRFCAKELLVFSTIGEENAGRGAIITVTDGSGTMSGQRNIWARAINMCLLHIARLEKRDFAMIEFSGGTQTEQWVFPAKQPLDAEKVISMASHFYGGGTVPLNGVAAAEKLLKEAAPFRKADLVIIGDGEASFGPEDKRMRDSLTALGVRFFGLGVGGSFRYLTEYCDHVVNVADFELADPSKATAELATHIT